MQQYIEEELYILNSNLNNIKMELKTFKQINDKINSINLKEEISFIDRISDLEQELTVVRQKIKLYNKILKLLVEVEGVK